MEIELLKIGEIEEQLIETVTVGIEYDNKLIFDRAKNVGDWVPNKNVEKGESPIETAVRLISDKLGAISFVLKPVIDYRVNYKGEESFGRVFYVKVERFDATIDSGVQTNYFKVPEPIYEELSTMKGEV